MGYRILKKYRLYNLISEVEGYGYGKVRIMLGYGYQCNDIIPCYGYVCTSAGYGIPKPKVM
jgi:hypothetical protein